MVLMANMTRHGRLLLGMALLVMLGAQASALAGYETRITSGTSWHTWPAISGDLVAYEDDRYGNVDIFLYNLSSGVETRLTDQACDHYWPKIYGDRVVWWDNRSGFNNFDIFMYNTTTGLETRITDNSYNQENADLYQDRIVWMDRRYGNFDVFMKDTKTGSETQLTNDAADQWEPQVWDDHVIWMDNRSNPGYDPDQYFDYYTYDLATGTEKALTTQGWAWYGGIHGDRAVWSQWRLDGSYPGGYNEQIYLYDFSTGTERRITSDISDHWYPKVYGDRIVWEDNRNGNWDIYLYNVTTGTEEQVTTLTPAQWNPVIWGNRIVYEDYRDDNPQIFVYTIITTPAPEFAANKTTGYAPLAVKFTDLTQGTVTGWLWDFGDGSATSAGQNPVHTYANPGTYTVTLTATNDAGSGTTTKDRYITVTEGMPAFPGYTNPPTDPDGDGIYEDVNGNGEIDYDDAVVMFWNIDWIEQKKLTAAFDLNGNGEIDYDDAVTLFWQV
jgi:beta propeller repeat protein